MGRRCKSNESAERSLARQTRLLQVLEDCRFYEFVLIPRQEMVLIGNADDVETLRMGDHSRGEVGVLRGNQIVLFTLNQGDALRDF